MHLQMNEGVVTAIVAAIVLPVIAAVARLVWVLPRSPAPVEPNQKLVSSPSKHVMVFLGSGGHTGEMLRMMGSVNLAAIGQRTWVTLLGDEASLVKARNYEENLTKDGKVSFVTVARARRVGESLLLSVKSTLQSFVLTAAQFRGLPTLPDLLLINGPGTLVPIAYILFVFNFVGLGHTKIVYIESLARVSGLSVSGWLLLPIANRFIVQWPQLQKRFPSTEYYGILV